MFKWLIDAFWKIFKFIKVGNYFGEFLGHFVSLWVGVLLMNDVLGKLVVPKCLLRLYEDIEMLKWIGLMFKKNIGE